MKMRVHTCVENKHNRHPERKKACIKILMQENRPDNQVSVVSYPVSNVSWPFDYISILSLHYEVDKLCVFICLGR